MRVAACGLYDAINVHPGTTDYLRNGSRFGTLSVEFQYLISIKPSLAAFVGSFPFGSLDPLRAGAP